MLSLDSNSVTPALFHPSSCSLPLPTSLPTSPYLPPYLLPLFKMVAPRDSPPNSRSASDDAQHRLRGIIRLFAEGRKGRKTSASAQKRTGLTMSVFSNYTQKGGRPYVAWLVKNGRACMRSGEFQDIMLKARLGEPVVFPDGKIRVKMRTGKSLRSKSGFAWSQDITKFLTPKKLALARGENASPTSCRDALNPGSNGNPPPPPSAPVA